MAGTIGKIVMVGAIAATFAAPLGLGEGFILENVRYELLIVAIFILLFSGFLLPTANLAGTHGPLIPLIPIVVAAGGHPMAFGLLIGAFGLLLAISKGGSVLSGLKSYLRGLKALICHISLSLLSLVPLFCMLY